MQSCSQTEKDKSFLDPQSIEELNAILDLADPYREKCPQAETEMKEAVARHPEPAEDYN